MSLVATRWFLIVPLAMSLVGPASGQQRHEPIEVPAVYQPLNFSGAVGTTFQVAMRPSKTDMLAVEPFVLTVRVTSVGPWWQPPKRPKLERQRRFKERFHIDRSASEQPDRVLTNPDAWEFDYQLRPLRPGVARIPPLAFPWYKPGPEPPLTGYFPTTYAHEVPIQVRAKEAPAPPRITAPAQFFQIAAGSAVPRREERYRLPGFGILILALLLPPAAGACWYVVWRQFYPDAARLARMRRSRAARQALRALRGLGRMAPPERAIRVAAITAGYLRNRLGLPPAEPTPGEVADHLLQLGASTNLAGKAADLFNSCDIARFAPHPGETPDDLAGTAANLILTLEAEPWSQS